MTNCRTLASLDGGVTTTHTPAPQLHGTLVSHCRPGATSFHHRVHPERSRRDAPGSTRNPANSPHTVTDTRDHRPFALTNASSGSTANRFWWVGRTALGAAQSERPWSDGAGR